MQGLGSLAYSRWDLQEECGGKRGVQKLFLDWLNLRSTESTHKIGLWGTKKCGRGLQGKVAGTTWESFT